MSFVLRMIFLCLTILFCCRIADLIDNIVCYYFFFCLLALQKIPLTFVCVCVSVCVLDIACVSVCECVLRGALCSLFSFKYKLLVDLFYLCFNFSSFASFFIIYYNSCCLVASIIIYLFFMCVCVGVCGVDAI